jgi:hypothetical protein
LRTAQLHDDYDNDDNNNGDNNNNNNNRTAVLVHAMTLLDGSEGSISRPGQFIPRKSTPAPTEQEAWLDSASMDGFGEANMSCPSNPGQFSP